MNNNAKWIWLAQMCGQGNREVITLLDKMSSIDEIYNSDYDDYIKIGVSERLASKMCDKSLDYAYSIISYCQTSRVGILCYDGEKFPKSLKSLKNPPVVLYYVGKLPDFNKDLCISIVGTRTVSEYGMRAAYKIAYEVASSGAVIVSGMALGIDGIASCATISAKGRTVAVLGFGIDIVYPKEHFKLKELIKQNGAVITEYPPSTPPRKINFPMRNRIISGLSQGTVVIDADLSSGALITASDAIMQGKDVYAVPGNIDDKNASGTNSLIRDGAQAVLCGADIIRNYAYLYRDSLNIQRMVNSEKVSEFSAAAIRNMGVGMKMRNANTAHNPKAQVEYKTREQMHHFVNVPKKNSAFKEENKENKENFREKVMVLEREKDRAELGDNSRAILESLTENQRKIFNEMPLDRAVTIDYLTRTGFGLGEVISALTILEVRGLVASLPGALYIRK